MSAREEIAKLYVATFNRAADADGLAYWVSDGTANTTSLTNMEDIASAMLQSPEAASLYAGLDRENTIIKMYDNLFNRTVDKNDSGIEYWSSGDGSSVSINEMIMALINGALDNENGNDLSTIVNKGSVGLLFADAGLNNISQAMSIMEPITSDSGTITNAISYIQELLNGATTTVITPNGVGDTVSIENFTAGDVIDFPDSNVSIKNYDLDDGLVLLTWHDDNGTNDTTVTVNGIAASDDINLFDVSEFNTVYGAGTII